MQLYSYNALESSIKVGRPKKDWQYRDRAGRKAANIRKVAYLQYIVPFLKFTLHFGN